MGKVLRGMGTVLKWGFVAVLFVGNIIGFRFRNLESWSIVSSIKFANNKKWHLLSQESNAYMISFFNYSSGKNINYSGRQTAVLMTSE